MGFLFSQDGYLAMLSFTPGKRFRTSVMPAGFDSAMDQAGNIYNVEIDLLNDSVFKSTDDGQSYPIANPAAWSGDRPWLTALEPDEVFLYVNLPKAFRVSRDPSLLQWTTLPTPPITSKALPDPLNPGNMNFTLNGGAVYTIPPGTYYFNNMKLVGGSVLNIVGKTTIYLTGDLDRPGGAIVKNSTMLASNLSILMTGGTASISSDGVFYGVIYAPNTPITYSGTADYFGALVGKSITINGDATAHYDESLDVNMGAYALRVMLVD